MILFPSLLCKRLTWCWLWYFPFLSMIFIILLHLCRTITYTTVSWVFAILVSVIMLRASYCTLVFAQSYVWDLCMLICIPVVHLFFLLHILNRLYCGLLIHSPIDGPLTSYIFCCYKEGCRTHGAVPLKDISESGSAGHDYTPFPLHWIFPAASRVVTPVCTPARCVWEQSLFHVHTWESF